MFWDILWDFMGFIFGCFLSFGATPKSFKWLLELSVEKRWKTHWIWGPQILGKLQMVFASHFLGLKIGRYLKMISSKRQAELKWGWSMFSDKPICASCNYSPGFNRILARKGFLCRYMAESYRDQAAVQIWLSACSPNLPFSIKAVIVPSGWNAHVSGIAERAEFDLPQWTS